MSNGINGQYLPRVWGDGNYQVNIENFVEGGGNGIQTFFMSREELEQHSEKQRKKFGMLDFETMRVKKYRKGKYVFDDEYVPDEPIDDVEKEITDEEDE